MCNCCNGDEAVFWKDESNHAFVDSNGNMLVTAHGKEADFRVPFCPMCGRPFVDQESAKKSWEEEKNTAILRDSLIKLIQSAVGGCATYWAGLIADRLIAAGVTIEELQKGE